MNRVILMGRMTANPEARYTTHDAPMAIVNFNLAVERQKKGEADFIRCIAFGKTAEALEKFGRKGLKIAIEGRWQTGSYTGKDERKVYTNDCIVERWEFAESKQETKDEGFYPVEDIGDVDLPF